jgi:DNA polymerase I-like protein with 3'-5' exonuclease and polymerase domains
MQIHDEVVGEVRADCAEKGASRVKEVIENAVNQVNWLVPIVVDSHFGESWSDAKKA